MLQQKYRLSLVKTNFEKDLTHFGFDLFAVDTGRARLPEAGTSLLAARQTSRIFASTFGRCSVGSALPFFSAGYSLTSGFLTSVETWRAVLLRLAKADTGRAAAQTESTPNLDLSRAQV